MTATNLSNMFALLSVGFAAPTLERAALLTDSTFVQDVCNTWQALDLPPEVVADFAEELQAYQGKEAEDVMHEIRREYTRLFMLDRLIENTEGAWRKKAAGQTQVFYMINDIAMEVQDFMHSCGVVRPAGYNESVDRIDNEWQFCSILATDPEYLSEQDVNAEEKLEQFVDEHIKSWVPGMSKQLKEESRIPYYRALATLQTALVEAL